MAYDRKKSNREYYLKNKEKLQAQHRLYAENNKEKILAYRESYYETNKEAIRERNRIYSRKNYAANFYKNQEYQKNYWLLLKDRTFAVFGEAKCVQCGFADKRALQFDHLNGGGRKHMRSFSSNKGYYKYVRENSHEFQVLCANCNSIKKVVNRECRKSPHEKINNASLRPNIQ